MISKICFGIQFTIVKSSKSFCEWSAFILNDPVFIFKFVNFSAKNNSNIKIEIVFELLHELRLDFKRPRLLRKSRFATSKEGHN